MPETSPALLWTGKVGDASAFRVWGSRAFVRDLSAENMSPRATPCVFLGFPPDAPGWQFYHPTSCRVLSSQDVTFNESVPYYRLFPYRTPSLPPPPLFLVPGPAPVDPLPPQGPAPSGVSQVDAIEPVEVAGDSGAAEGAEPGGADSGGAERCGLRVLLLGVLSLEVLSLGVLRLGVLSLGVLRLGVLSVGVLRLEVLSLGVRSLRELGLLCRVWRYCAWRSPGASSRREPLSPQELRGSGLPGAGGVLLELEVLRLLRVLVSRVPEVLVLGVLELLGLRVRLELELLRVLALRLPLSVLEAVLLGVLLVLLEVLELLELLGVLELEVLLALVLPLGVLVLSLLSLESPRGLGPYFVPLPSAGSWSPAFYWSSSSLRVSTACPVIVTVTAASPLPPPSPYTGPTGGLAERREPAFRPASPICPARTSGRGSRQRPPPVPGTHRMSLCPSTTPLRAPLPSPPESSLPALADPESDSLRAASPTVTRLLATLKH
ncbi:unnamed protein product [Closterium sp. NIES-65]|nr:unnamed protein product [Closterium sp. NIES-65]